MSDALRILILEDSPADAELMRRELQAERISFTATRVWTEADFVAELRTRTPDIILADYTLPAYDGLSALRFAEQEHPEIPFIFVSGNLGEETAIDALHHGATDYVLKHRLARLGPAVRRALREIENRRGRDEAERQRRAAEVDLRRVSQEWEEIFQAIGHPTVIIDPDHNLIAANHAVLRTTGKTADELRGSKCYQIFHGECVSVPAPGCPMERMRTTGCLEMSEVEVQMLGGTYLVSCTPIMDDAGCLQKVIHIATDITGRRKAEKALRESEDRFKSIFDHVTDGILLVDPDTGVFLMANRMMGTMLGCTDEELLQLGVLDIHAGEDLRAIEAVFRQHRAEQPVLIHDLAMTRKDQTVFFADVSAALVTIVGRQFVMMNVRDVTDRRALQAELAQADRLSSMGMLAAGVAHEINNPLAYVLFNIETLAEELPQFIGNVDAKRDDLVRAATEALDGTMRIRNIVRGLSVFSRVDKAEHTRVDVQYVFECAASMAQNEIKYRARLVRAFEPVPAVWASEGRLCQVFLNLLINAAHAIVEGHPDQNSITIRTYAEEGHVIAEVSDTGVGISSENLERVFDPFFTTKPAGLGSGLGLAISTDIITGFGGDIHVESQAGTGSRFIVRLPAMPDAPAERRDAVEPGAPRFPAVRGRILIVDDEAPMRSILQQMLGRQHDVVTAASGAEGQAILEKDQAFDVILCDLMMLELSGMDLHEWLAAKNPVLAGQVVFLTGGAFTPRAAEYLSRVPNLTLEKPIGMAALRRVVEECILAGRRNQRADGTEV